MEYGEQGNKQALLSFIRFWQRGYVIIKVLGSGCKKCKKLEKNAKKAVKELGLNYTVIKVDNPMDIASYGVMATPALVINNQVMISGRVADVMEIRSILRGAVR